MIRSLESLEEVLKPGSLLAEEADLAAYSYDGALDRGRPEAVILAHDGAEVVRAVRWCAKHKVPFTARGAGTNLSGGCIPLRGGALIALARLDRILAIDTRARFAMVEPGVVNLKLQKELEKAGFFYAPDPASFKVSTLGGNLAENAGGPRCLKYGTTTNHVLAVEAVMPDGTLSKFDLSGPGPELASLLVGAEGTLGIILKAWVRILPLPGNIRTMLAGFPSIDAAVACVADIVAAGVLPRVLEALDRTTVESVEAYSHAGYPKAEAVLLIELDGDPREVAQDAKAVEGLCRKNGSDEVRSAQTEGEREKLWEGRRGAYAAMARLAPNVMVEDGVVPRDKLPEVVRRIQEITAKYKLRAGLLFHAGDGNIHPNVAYDERDLEETKRVKAAGHEILQACVELGGSLSGEHGIGVDKRDAMAWLFTPETLDLFRRIKREIDPDNLANPDKLFPLPSDKSPRKFIRPASPELSEQARHLVSKLRQYSAENRTVSIAGSGSRLRDVPEGHAALLTTSLNRITDIDKKNYTLTVEAGISPYDLHMKLKKEDCFIRLPECGGTLGGMLAARIHPALRDDLLGMRLLLADGTVVELGGKVVKNVAGYDVPRLVLGSWGTLGVILEATFKIYGRPQAKLIHDPQPHPFAPNEWHRRVKRAFDPRNLLNPWIFGMALAVFFGLAGGSLAADPSPLARRYKAGEVLKYSYAGTHALNGKINRTFGATASAVVVKGSSGTLHEEIKWTEVLREGKEVKLPPGSASFRQMLSLDPEVPVSIPDLSKLDSALYAPITDLLTFYVDARLASKNAAIHKPGDHAYQKYGKESSWADGTKVTVGYDCIDFDISYISLSKDGGTATIKVRHVPPPDGCGRALVDWMKKRVADSANNWFQVEKKEDGRFEVGNGVEIFDAEIKLQLPSGIIESATLDNSVETEQRICTDEKLSDCGPPKKVKILRKITLSLLK